MGDISPRANVQLNDGSTLIANYNDGVPMIAIKGKIVGLNIYPITSNIYSKGIPYNQPGVKIFGRACLHAAGLDPLL